MWDCTFCTVQNTDDLERCMVCDTERNKEEDIAEPMFSPNAIPNSDNHQDIFFDETDSMTEGSPNVKTSPQIIPVRSSKAWSNAIPPLVSEKSPYLLQVNVVCALRLIKECSFVLLSLSGHKLRTRVHEPSTNLLFNELFHFNNYTIKPKRLTISLMSPVDLNRKSRVVGRVKWPLPQKLHECAKGYLEVVSERAEGPEVLGIVIVNAVILKPENDEEEEGAEPITMPDVLSPIVI